MINFVIYIGCIFVCGGLLGKVIQSRYNIGDGDGTSRTTPFTPDISLHREADSVIPLRNNTGIYTSSPVETIPDIGFGTSVVNSLQLAEPSNYSTFSVPLDHNIPTYDSLVLSAGPEPDGLLWLETPEGFRASISDVRAWINKTGQKQ